VHCLSTHQPGRAVLRTGPAPRGRHNLVEEGRRPAARPTVRIAQRRDRARFRRGGTKAVWAAVEADQARRGATADAWWSVWPPDKAIVFSLHIEQAVLIEWDTQHGLITVHRWSPTSGYRKTNRVTRKPRPDPTRRCPNRRAVIGMMVRSAARAGGPVLTHPRKLGASMTRPVGRPRIHDDC
jgi:hypothetical protein